MLFDFLARARRDQTGASAVEYGLLVTGIAGIAVLVIFALGGVTNAELGGACSRFNAKASTSQSC